MQFFAPVSAPGFIPYMDKRQGSFAASENYFFLAALGLFAPYFERACIRPETP